MGPVAFHVGPCVTGAAGYFPSVPCTAPAHDVLSLKAGDPAYAFLCFNSFVEIYLQITHAQPTEPPGHPLWGRVLLSSARSHFRNPLTSSPIFLKGEKKYLNFF